MIDFYEEVLVLPTFTPLTKGFVIVLNRCVIHIYTYNCTVYNVYTLYTLCIHRYSFGFNAIIK